MSLPDDTTSKKGALRGILDDLYGRDPSGFTTGRAAHVAEARRAGDRELARQIGKLPRPSRAAHALNLLARERPGDMERLLRLAGSLQDASKRLAGSELRKLGTARRQMIDELTSEAARLAAEGGVPASGPTLEEIAESLQAALLDGAAARAVSSGHLARALQVAAIGTAELSEALPSLPGERPGSDAGTHSVKGRSVKPPSKKRSSEAVEAGAGNAAEKAAAAALQAAEETLRRSAKAAGTARKELESARRLLDRAASRRRSAEEALASARRDELAGSKAVAAAEVAERRAAAALEVAERSRRRAVDDGRRAGPARAV